MNPHREAPRKGLGTWLTVIAGAGAGTILVWGVMEIARARNGARPSDAATQAAEDTRSPLPPGTRLYTEVFSVSDAALHRGTWFVLDRRGSQVHRISESGALLGSFGQRGEGPGELSRPVAIASHGDTVVVLDGAQMHLFGPGGEHLADRPIWLGSCANSVPKDLVSLSAGLLLLVDCSASDRTSLMAILEAGDGSLQTLAVRVGDPGTADVRMAIPALGVHPQGFVFGLASDDCLEIFSPQGAELGEVCHDWIERLPIPKALEDQMARVRAQARQAGIRLVEFERLPPFVQVFLVDQELAYQVPLPEDLESFRLVRRGPSGQAVGFPLPVAEGLFADGNSVLLWWEDLEGTRIAVHNLGTP